MTPRRWKGALGASLLLLGSIVVAFVAAEIAVRLWFPTPVALRLEAGGDVEGLPDDALYERGAGGVTLRPNARVRLHDHPLSRRDIEIRTNALGQRGADLGAKESGDVRILVLGDSITFGDYVAEEETYPARIKQALRASSAPRSERLFVVNAGVGSIGIEEMVARLENGGLAVDPDIVLVGLYLNDADPSLFIAPLRLPGILNRSHLAHLVADRLRGLSLDRAVEARMQERQADYEAFVATHPGATSGSAGRDATFDQEIARAFSDWGFAWSEASWRKIEENVRTLQRKGWENGFELALVLHPVRLQVESGTLRDEPQKRFQDLGRRLGIPTLDLLPTLRTAWRDRGVALYYDHCHYTPDGNALVGEAIARWIRVEGIDVPSTKRGRP